MDQQTAMRRLARDLAIFSESLGVTVARAAMAADSASYVSDELSAAIHEIWRKLDQSHQILDELLADHHSPPAGP